MENAYAEETKYLSDKAAAKSRFRELSTSTKQQQQLQKTGKYQSGSGKEATNFGFKFLMVLRRFLTNLKKL